jgi:hypothetical protein
MPAIARPIIRALLLCAVAQTKDLSHDVSAHRAHAKDQAPMHLRKLEDGNSGEEDVFDLVCVSRRSFAGSQSRSG